MVIGFRQLTQHNSKEKAVILRSRQATKDLRTDLTAVLNAMRRLRLAKSRLRRLYPKGISSLRSGTRLHSAVALVFDFATRMLRMDCPRQSFIYNRFAMLRMKNILAMVIIVRFNHMLFKADNHNWNLVSAVYFGRFFLFSLANAVLACYIIVRRISIRKNEKRSVL